MNFLPSDSITHINNAYAKKTTGGGGSHSIYNNAISNINIGTTKEKYTEITHNLAINTRIPHIPKHLLEYKINPKAFINAHNFPTMQDLVEEVKRLDNDKNAYLSMLHEPVFLDNFNPFTYYEDRLFTFLDSIFSQDKEQAYRRGRSQAMDNRTRDSYFMDGEHIRKLLNEVPFIFNPTPKLYIKYTLKLLRHIYRASHYPRALLRKFKDA